MPILAIPFPTFQPSMRIITAITQANPAVITTSFAHQYITGTIVRIDVPIGFGMTQINQQFGPIVVLSSVSFSIAINTIFYTAFTVPGSSAQQAQAVPIAEVASILTAAVQNVLPYP